MAVIKSSALYGTGVYSGSVFGTRNVSFALTGVAGTGAIKPIVAGGFEIDISERLGNVSATGSVNTVTVNIQEDIVGISATGAVTAVQLVLGFTETLPSFGLTGSIGTISPNVKEELGANAVTSVSGTALVNTVKVNIKENLLVSINSTSATGSIGFANSNVIAIQFDFEAVKTRYSRRRTVMLPRVA